MTKKFAPLLFGILISTLVGCSSKNDNTSQSQPDSSASVVKWKVATIAYTFRNFTFFDAVKKTKELGLHYIGGYPGQTIGGNVEGTMDFTMDTEKQKKILSFLKENDVKLIDFGVITPKSEAEWQQLFEFARSMDIPTIVSEPQPEQLDFVAELCEKFKIDVAIHNHPAPSLYANPDTLAAVLSGLSTRIGACADVGHWIRSGFNPVESMKKLEGRILELHFKDESVKGKEAVEVVWGTGVADVKGMLEELNRQGFHGYLSVEYESKPEDNMAEIKESLAYYNSVVKKFKN